MEPARVECHSGTEYAERPVAVWMDGRRELLRRVMPEARTPDEVRFLAESEEGRRFRLIYRRREDRWTVRWEAPSAGGR